MEYVKFLLQVQWRDTLNHQKESKKKESAGRIFRKNLKQHLATESGSDSDDGDNQSDLVPQAITPKKHTKKSKFKLVKLNLSQKMQAIIIFIRCPRKLQGSKMNWFPFETKKEAEEIKNFREISKHNIKIFFFFNYVDDNLTDVLLIELSWKKSLNTV